MKCKEVENWELAVKIVEETCPRTCFTCSNELEGNCQLHGMKIPEEFYSKVGECGDFSREAF